MTNVISTQDEGAHCRTAPSKPFWVPPPGPAGGADASPTPNNSCIPGKPDLSEPSSKGPGLPPRTLETKIPQPQNPPTPSSVQHFPVLPSIPDWAFTATAITLAALAIALFTWNRLRPRTRLKPICSKCNYDLDGHHLADAPHFPITCPECGKTFTTAAQLFAHPRRWMTPLVVMLLVSAYGVSRVPHIHQEGWWASLPLSGRILIVRAAGPNHAPATLLDSVAPAYEVAPGRYLMRGYTAWQAGQLLAADTSWKRQRVWLADMPIPGPLRTAPWQPEIGAPVILTPPTPTRTRRVLASDRSYINYWFRNDAEFRAVQRGNRLEISGLYVELSNGQRLDLQYHLEVVARLDLVKRPLSATASRQAVEQLNLQGFSLDTAYFGLSSTGTATELPEKTVAGLRLTVFDGSAPIAEARWHQRVDTPLSVNSTIIPFGPPGKNSAKNENFLFASDLGLPAWLADPDDRFTVRITTDPEMVLSDFEATHYLDVDITLPGSALKRKPPTTVTPPAAAQP